MSEKLSRFMQGIREACDEREPHEVKPFLAAMHAGATWREMRDRLRGDRRGEDDWRGARVYLEFKLSALLEAENKTQREQAPA